MNNNLEGFILRYFQNCRKVRLIPVIQIEPSRAQPRVCFTAEELNGLSESIKENGILQPISVRKVFAAKFELIAGERRLRAAVMAGFKSVPCLVFKCEETQAAILALLENLQRYNLNMFEEAQSLQKLIQIWGISKDLLAKKLGINQTEITNKLNLLKLTKPEQKRIISANLSQAYIILLLKIDDEKQRKEALNKIISNHLSIFETEQLIESMLNKDFCNENNISKSNMLYDIVKDINRKVEESNQNINKSTCFKTETSEYVEYTVRFLKINENKKEESA